jgi:hypothetical protein
MTKQFILLMTLATIVACSGNREFSDVGSTCIGPTSQWATYPHTVIISTNEVRSLGEGRGIGPLKDCKVRTPYEWTCWTRDNQIVLRNGTVTEGLYTQGLASVSKFDWCFANPRPREKSNLQAKLLCLIFL